MTECVYTNTRIWQVLERCFDNVSMQCVFLYRLIHLWFKIQEIFPEGAAHQVNKRVRMHEFVYKICKSRGKYFLYF